MKPPNEKFRRRLLEARRAGYSWGVGLYRDGRLPIDSYVIPSPDRPRTWQAQLAAYEEALLRGYLDAAEQDRKTKALKKTS